MISKLEIDNILDDLQVLFDSALNSNNNQQAAYYSKLAVIELCGWLEFSFDGIIKIFRPKINNQTNINYFDEQIIKPVYGFEYNKHFRKMLIMVIGLINVEKIEIAVNNSSPSGITILKSQLGTLKAERNSLAHTFISGIQTNLVTPIGLKSRLQTIYPIIKNIEKELIKQKGYL